MDTKPTITSKLNHHWPQYGMKTLILGVTVTCLLLGVLGSRLRQAREQRQLVAAIGRLGGTVGYDMRNMKDAGCLVTGILGVDLAANVDLVDLTARPATAPSHSANRQVELRSTISNADLFLLSRLPHLRVLRLTGTGIGDEGLVHIKGLTGLRCLYLNATQITDAGLSELRGLHDLRMLYFDRTKVTGKGLVNLRKLKRLEILDLEDTRVTDAGLAHLGHLPALRFLNLRGTNVTDAGIMHLRDLATLSVLCVERTGVTAKGVETLKQHLPFVRLRGPSDPSTFGNRADS
jgi:hypothetical protein